MTTFATTTDILASANELLAEHAALISRVRSSQQQHRRRLHTLHTPPHDLLRLPLISSPSRTPSPEDSPPPSPALNQRSIRPGLTAVKLARATRFLNYVPEEETIRNDYSQRYVEGGEWPQDWVLGAEPEHRFEEYPKQQRLLNLKKSSVNNHSLPPAYLHYSQLSTLNPSKFDVILLDPPFSSTFNWDTLQELPIPSLAADPSYVFLWVGSGAGEGLERGREVLAKWGYRRCEDVVWVKTNRTTNKGPGTDPPTTSLLTRTKQHCLIGIRGTVRRSTDSWFVHCNVDTDVIIWEGDPSDPTRKPPEMYTLIENFCLGMRRLEVFGRPSSLRRGWVTVLGQGQEEHLQALEDGTVHVAGEEGGRGTVWNRETWEEGIKELSNGGKPVVPMTQEIDALRPKSPLRGGQGGGNQQGNAGGGQQAGVGGGGGGNNRFTGGVGGGGGGVPLSGGLVQGGGMPMRMGGGAFGNMVVPGGNPMMGQNQMAGVQPGMMNMGLPQLMNNGMGMEEMMGGGQGGGWNTGMGGHGMAAMNVGGMPGMGMANVINPGGMGGMMGNPGMNGGMGSGQNHAGMQMNMVTQMGNQMAGQMGSQMGGQMGGQMGNQMVGQLGQMQGQMGMNSVGFGQGMPGMFNPAMNSWTDQGHFGMEASGWEGDGMNGMAGMGMQPGMMGSMNLPGMNLNPMNMGQWGGGGGGGGMNHPGGTQF